MRRLPLLLILAPFACSNSEPDDNFVENKTVIQVSPDAFLRGVPCSSGGGMERYQATLVDVTPGLDEGFDPPHSKDVTPGLDEGFELPHSKVVPCNSALNFEYVREGHSYIAHVVGFDRSDIRAQNPGSPIVVDDEGVSVEPRFKTTCWGRDGEEPPDFTMGGASGKDEDLALGGGSALGVTAHYQTTIVVRGCEPLVDSGTPGTTAVSFSLESSLTGQSCGSGEGQIHTFSVSPPTGGSGGAGGAGNPSPSADGTPCGESLILDGLPASEHLSFELSAYEEGKTSPSWTTSCQAFTVEGITVSAGCGPLTDT